MNTTSDTPLFDELVSWTFGDRADAWVEAHLGREEDLFTKPEPDGAP